MPVELKSETVSIRAMFLLFTTDLQAKAIILEMIAHNGYCSCSYCDDPGHAPKNKKGKKQHAYAYDGTGSSRSSEQWAGRWMHRQQWQVEKWLVVYGNC